MAKYILIAMAVLLAMPMVWGEIVLTCPPDSVLPNTPFECTITTTIDIIASDGLQFKVTGVDVTAGSPMVVGKSAGMGGTIAIIYQDAPTNKNFIATLHLVSGENAGTVIVEWKGRIGGVRQGVWVNLDEPVGIASLASPPSPSPSPGPACTPDPGCGGQLSRCAGINAVTCTEQFPGCFVNSEVTTCQNGCSGGNCIVPRQEPERPNDQPRADPQSVVIPDDRQRSSVEGLLRAVNDDSLSVPEKLSRIAGIVREMLFPTAQE